MISEEALGRELGRAATDVSAAIAEHVKEEIDAGILRRGDTAETVDLAIKTAWQIGLETGLRVAEIDRLGATALLESIEKYVQEYDAMAIAAGRETAVKILEGVLR